MRWKDLIVSRRVALLKWLLPLVIVLWVLLYQSVLVPLVHGTWGMDWHKIMEIALYGAVGPLVTFFVLAWIQRWLVEKERAERKVREQEERLTLVRLEEDRRIAQHLHREVLPNLAYVANKIDHIRGKLLGPKGSEFDPDRELEGVTGTLRETVGELREKINALRKGLPLRSPEGSDFIAEVRRRAAAFGRQHGVEVSVGVRGEERPLPSGVEVSLWRILGEALGNVALHAQARQVRLELAFDSDRVTLRVRDDGRGFDARAWRAAPKGLGLIHMREEADEGGGTLEVESAPGAGTEILAAFPWKGASTREREHTGEQEQDQGVCGRRP